MPASSGLEVLLNVLSCTGQPPQPRLLAQNVNMAEVEKRPQSNSILL